MEMKLSRTRQSLSGGTWYVGRTGGYHFEALVFTEPSRYGLDGGHVSKLYLFDGPRGKRRQQLAVYERGWELEPSEAVRSAVELLVAELGRFEREGRTAEE